jgi:hypothetical protein
MSHQASLKQQQLLGKIQVLKQGGMSVDYSEAQFTELAGHYLLGEAPEEGWLVDGWLQVGQRSLVLKAGEGMCNRKSIGLGDVSLCCERG